MREYNISKENIKYNVRFMHEVRGDILPVHPIITLIKNRGRDKKAIINGEVIRIESNRLKVFTESTSCSCCGGKAKFFVMEKTVNHEYFHLNMYGMNENGRIVVFTRDHIKPRCKGGSESLDNQITMCITCNQKKGDKYED